ncbi:TPA: hypothetical protein ACJGT4_003401 [Salmonella enterica subsp. enterica]|nr:hypothetical protein [Salmonella enterica]ECC5260176.1 hypothetical protein [Salmonella enterica]MIL91747.1 hypothetical protein [Salmonella enterica]
MTTITINTYDAAGRFDMNDAQAKEFFSFVEKQAIDSGYAVEFIEAVSVDEESERFVENCFINY